MVDKPKVTIDTLTPVNTILNKQKTVTNNTSQKSSPRRILSVDTGMRGMIRRQITT